MLLERARLDAQINSLQAQLAELPDGKLICCRNDNRYKWYHSKDHQKLYIPKKNRHFAEQLAAKKYLSLRLEELSHEKQAIDLYLKFHSANEASSTKLLTETSGYQELLTPFFQTTSQTLSDWTNSSYEQNPNFPELLIHKSSSGHLVRSKSEAIIDTLLYLNKIPFRYECALHLDSIVLFPDFTIRHPENGSTFYWEHFGMMDNTNYIQKTCSKLRFYAEHGIIPNIQLITTYETKEHPLSSDIVDKIIHHYFLS